LDKVTRRGFIRQTAFISGGSYASMLALGLINAAPARAFELEKGNAAGKHIIILGAGLCGMTCAYELMKLGHKVTVLEARDRTGGRCWSPANGTVSEEVNKARQTASFDDGLYFNAGPSRIPHNHQLTMHYCREFGVPLQVYNNVNEGAYYFSEGKGSLSNKKIKVREVHNDMRGYTTELLAKAMDHGKLDTALSLEDGQKLIEYLRAEGGLDIDKLYKASARRGYMEAPGAGNKVGKIADPHQLSDIIQSGLLDPDFYNVAEYTYELQMTMFQAVGGMEQIAKALEKLVAKAVHKGAEVSKIANTDQGVKITYKDRTGVHELEGDLCICTIPLPVLSNINHNFSSAVSRAIDFTTYNATGKIGLQFKRRFWEEDENIFGGITHTNNDLTQIFYPSNNYLEKNGILIGYYNFNDKAKRIGELSIADREKFALSKGALIHEQYAKEFEKSFSVSWQKVPYSMGGWAVYNTESRNTLYPALIKPDNNVYFAGEHTSYLNAWMAGAFESARSVVASVHARITEQRIAYQSQTT
jgi:monoamine oxidase